MNKKEERAYEQGRREVYADIIRSAIRGLGYEGRPLESLVAEREAAISALRNLCAKHGDNEWSNNLHLADIIEKHIGRHLDE